MDTVTHALAGAVIARVYGGHRRGGFTPAGWTWLGAAAAAFPDVDIVALVAGPLAYLAYWHRGPTHSLLLWPLWAALLAAAVGHAHRGAYRDLFALFALAILSHILLDVITVYGTQVAFPMSQWRAAWGTTFILDPVLTVSLGAALLASARTQSRRMAVWGLLAVTAWIGLQGLMKLRAQALAAAHAQRLGVAGSETAALPQPLSPGLWKLVVAEPERLHVAYVNLWSTKVTAGRPQAGLMRRWYAHYRPPQALHWVPLSRFGETPESRALARTVWRQPALALYRRFARFPRLYRIDAGARVCVWFVDARYEIPEVPAPFRYGMCRGAHGGPWRLYRLRRNGGPVPVRPVWGIAGAGAEPRAIQRPE